MRIAVLVACLALVAAAAAVTTADPAADAEVKAPAEPAEPHRGQPDEPRSRPQRWVVFRPMFATRGRQRQLNRAWKVHELRRQSRPRGQRHRRALHFPTGGASSGDESGLALRVAVNDLLFQSAPANDLPEATARVVAPGAPGGAGLRPMLLARLRGASRVREPAAEEEAFLLMSAAGGRPAIVPAPTTRPRYQAPAAHKKQAHHKHKPRKGDKQRRRVVRDTSVVAALGQRLDAAMAGSVQERGAIAERVKKYDAQGMYPAYSYTNGRYTRAAAAAAAAPARDGVKVMKVKVQGAVDDEDEEEEGMEAAETIVFRPLFVHRDRQAVKQDARRRRLGFAKKSTKPAAKPLRRRPAAAAAPTAATALPVKRPSAAAAYFHRRTYLKYPPRYQYSPYRRVVYYN
ncbi:uncharacterized protein LOC127751101 [Frankliniella occidentalis]|uniref:Uncharacterized protein LOC127751101 n=1 Tax=Frankliniella occidentalis TaxID=133901 RepID=A0A9C6XT59_FRAOC|nr:uncharacterized protein LOC127751101 [Frankliniella occidentalis]